MIRKSWWKILSVVLLIYTFIGGMLIPLRPGIQDVEPSSASTGQELRLEVEGYNAHYVSGRDGLRAWLKLDAERALGAEEIEVRDERHLTAVFDLPEYLPVDRRVQDFTLILDNPVDGPSVLPSAVFVRQDSVNVERGAAGWPNAAVSELNERNYMSFPFRNILAESIRNTYFHVPLWFGMLFLFLGSVIYSIRYLRGKGEADDLKAKALTRIGIFFGLLGLLTGAVWAKNTWGEYWSWDVKQNMTAIALLIYFAYFVLRSSFEDPERQARISAVYNIFAFVALIPLIYVIPRLTDSLHPGAGGNPAFGSQDLDNSMRLIFYPAIIGWTLLGYWMASLSYRADCLRRKLLFADYPEEEEEILVKKTTK